MQSRANSVRSFFKVTRRMVKQSIFCVVEDSDAPYIILNRLENINLKVAQTEDPVQEFIGVGEQCSFSWTDFEVVDPTLSVEFFFGDI